MDGKYSRYLWVFGGTWGIWRMYSTCVNHQRTNHPVARYIHYSKGSIRRKVMLQIVVYRGDVSGRRGDRGLLTQGEMFIGVDCQQLSWLLVNEHLEVPGTNWG